MGHFAVSLRTGNVKLAEIILYITHLQCFASKCVIEIPFPSGYSMLERNRGWAGTELPASFRFFFSSTSLIQIGSLRPRPTSRSDPTTARTIFLRKRFAVIVKQSVVISPPLFSSLHRDVKLRGAPGVH